MWDVAFAQATQQPSGPSTMVSLIPLILVFLVFYFLLIRPQQRKLKAHREMLAMLKRNDQVMTSGGIFGKVVELSEKDNTVTLEVAPNVRIRVHKPQITTLIRPEKVPAKEAKEQ